jgi:hypothetical protein
MARNEPHQAARKRPNQNQNERAIIIVYILSRLGLAPSRVHCYTTNLMRLSLGL